jgi:hypothetical protein
MVVMVPLLWILYTTDYVTTIATSDEKWGMSVTELLESSDGIQLLRHDPLSLKDSVTLFERVPTFLEVRD